MTPVDIKASENSDKTTAPVLIHRTRDSPKSLKWVKTVVLNRSDCSPEIPIPFALVYGGSITIVPAVLDRHEQEEVTSESIASGFFRSYQIQAGKEPRAHFLLHKEATEISLDEGEEDTAQQPGYKYGATTMRARPLSKLPKVEALANKIELISRRNIHETTDVGAYWNLGVNVILYRNGNDSIGRHKDDAQGEQVVFTVIPYCPFQRRVVVESDNKLERYDLLLSAGDAYIMDAEMQKHYKHSVPKVTVAQHTTKCDRIAIVFRRGSPRKFSKDSGESLKDLTPKTTRTFHNFGHVPGVEEGVCYGPAIFGKLKAHASMQTGVSGNRKQGCDSIIVAKNPSSDFLFQFDYSAILKHGGYALAISALEGVPIRVFRSSKCAATGLFAPSNVVKSTGQTYRYDGLFRAHFNPQYNEDDPTRHTYTMIRTEKGPSVFENNLDNVDFISKCANQETLSKSALSALEETRAAKLSTASFDDSQPQKHALSNQIPGSDRRRHIKRKSDDGQMQKRLLSKRKPEFDHFLRTRKHIYQR